MRRRSRASRKTTKARSRKAKAQKPARHSSSSVAGQETEVARFHRERDEALEQLSATSEVLQVISSSPGGLGPVFQAILSNATRICEAQFGVLFQSEGDRLRAVAMHDAPQPVVEEWRKNPIIKPAPTTTVGRALARKRPVQIADVLNEPQYFNVPSGYTSAKLAKLAGARTILAVPMLKENELIGAIVIYRQEVHPFTDRQIELVKNFAAQAVIAIENVRLFKVEQQRTRELSETLEQQTATSEVLRIISSSPGELQPVFEAVLEKATRLCQAKFGNLFLREQNGFRYVAMHGAPPSYTALGKPLVVLSEHPYTPLAEAGRTKKPIHLSDLRVERCYVEQDTRIVPLVDVAGARTILTVPVLKDDEAVGAIAIYRQEVRPLNELRESLQQQTATSEVLRVISSSPGELEPVFNAMLENATRICEAKFGSLYLYDEDGLTLAATHNAPPAFAEARRRGPIQPGPDMALGLVIRTMRIA